MNPGVLNQKITISRNVATNDGMGGSTTALSAILTCWARVGAPKSRDGLIAGADLDIRTHEVTIRRENVEPARGDVVTWRSKTLKVKNVREDVAYYSLDCVLEE